MVICSWILVVYKLILFTNKEYSVCAEYVMFSRTDGNFRWFPIYLPIGVCRGDCERFFGLLFHNIINGNTFHTLNTIVISPALKPPLLYGFIDRLFNARKNKSSKRRVYLPLFAGTNIHRWISLTQIQFCRKYFMRYDVIIVCSLLTKLSHWLLSGTLCEHKDIILSV